MSLRTTTIGAYPKPDYVKLPDWFDDLDSPDPTAGWAEALNALGDDAGAILERGTHEAVLDQVNAGIDIPTDGEIARENYIHYHCRHLEGIDFEQLSEKALRTGNYLARLPTVRGPLQPRDLFLADDWKRAQQATDRPVKITMPGPLTVGDTIVDDYYGDLKTLGKAVAEALNQEVLSLAEAGCRHIQIDEPLFARYPERALEFGVENLERAFHGCPEGVMRTAHMCCGYPDRIDREDYPKAPLDSYVRIADAMEESSVMAISLEDAHRHNDLNLLDRYKTTTIILGVVAIAKSRVEPVEEIRERLKAALEHIDAERLIAAPDCGLGILGRDLALKKLRNLSEAAHSLP
ncbi:MAG: 5-methyltetrahydropteroyltriglutamate--homocysteine methyltransferase [SAR324 cluster bacterium]|nr:5-methyltetrahydropteroyltriglutamate--homocysteine methyltransferase [SAR324 cluster bacterium]MEE2717271.1 5-methyltetrahydropteroyltriglutamate--homocysteine methyltransferase [SAR324 cluster bacterium]